MPAETLPGRCPWCGSDPDYVAYHDDEWGVPVHDDRAHFELLVLEGAQAGLAWLTILRKREGYRRAFAGFDPAKVARFTPKRVEKLLADPGIVRHRLKLESAVDNAKAFVRLQQEHGSFDAWIWSFVDGAPLQSRRRRMADLPAQTDLSKRLSKELKRRGFRFVGPTVVYAYMQAAGLVNDHLVACDRHRALGGAAPARRSAKARGRTKAARPRPAARDARRR